MPLLSRPTHSLPVPEPPLPVPAGSEPVDDVCTEAPAADIQHQQVQSLMDPVEVVPPPKKVRKGGVQRTTMSDDQVKFLVSRRIELESFFKDAGNGNRNRKKEVWLKIRLEMMDDGVCGDLPPPSID